LQPLWKRGWIGAREWALGDRFGEAREHFNWTMAILGAIFALPTIVSLVQRGFDIHLNWGFVHFVEFYRAVAMPVVSMVEAPIRMVFGLLHLSWEIPQWALDLHTLSFVLAAIYVRGWGEQREAKVKAMRALSDELAAESFVGRNFWELFKWEELDYFNASPRVLTMLWRTAIALVMGFTGLGILAFIQTIAMGALHGRSQALARLRDPASRPDGQTQIGATADYLWAEVEAYRYMAFVRVLTATACAVIVFYIGNAIAPQLATQ
jgi:hypothetical protein